MVLEWCDLGGNKYPDSLTIHWICTDFSLRSLSSGVPASLLPGESPARGCQDRALLCKAVMKRLCLEGRALSWDSRPLGQCSRASSLRRDSRPGSKDDALAGAPRTADQEGHTCPCVKSTTLPPLWLQQQVLGETRGQESGERGVRTAVPSGVPWWGGVPDTPATRSLPFVSRASPGGLSTGKTRGLVGEPAGPAMDLRGIPGPRPAAFLASRARTRCAGTRRCVVLMLVSPLWRHRPGAPPTLLAQSGAAPVPDLHSRSRSASHQASRSRRLPEGRGQPGDRRRARPQGRSVHAASGDARVPTANQ